MDLTSEQKNIYLLASKMKIGETLKINACAGSGKTSTLIQIMRGQTNRTFLYLVFNSGMREEAEKKISLKNVRICTSHGLAKQELRITNIVNTYRLGDYAEFLDKDYRELKNNNFMDRLKKFIASKDVITDDLDILAIFRKARNGEIKYSHDLYLKEYQINLAKGKLKLDRYDYVLLDEAQDTTASVYDIFCKATARKIMVGDINQNIYSFRQTINILKFPTTYEANLTKCFRCQQPILDKAYAMLVEHKHPAPKMITGFTPSILDGTKAILCRTNHSIFDILHQLISIKKEHILILEKEPSQFLGVTVDLYYYLTGQTTQVMDKRNIAKFMKITRQYHLNKFEDFFTENLCDDYDLQLAYDTVCKRDYEVVDIYNKAVSIYINKNNKSNRVTLTTCHSSKGREWDSVFIYHDFDTTLPERIYEWRCNKLENSHRLSSSEKKKRLEQYKKEYIIDKENEVNLYYVSMTRSKQELVDFSWDSNNNGQDDKTARDDLKRKSNNALNDFFGFDVGTLTYKSAPILAVENHSSSPEQATIPIAKIPASSEAEIDKLKKIITDQAITINELKERLNAFEASKPQAKGVMNRIFSRLS